MCREKVGCSCFTVYCNLVTLFEKENRNTVALRDDDESRLFSDTLVEVMPNFAALSVL